MKNLIPESIAPIDIFKIAEKFTPQQEENTHLAVLFACYKLENILSLFASNTNPFSVAESADSFGINFCNNESLLRMAYQKYHEEDLVTGALFLAKVKKDRRAANYGALNPILEISRLRYPPNCGDWMNCRVRGSTLVAGVFPLVMSFRRL